MEANLAAMLNNQQFTLPEYKGIQSNSSTLKDKKSDASRFLSPKSSLLDKTNGEPMRGLTIADQFEFVRQNSDNNEDLQELFAGMHQIANAKSMTAETRQELENIKEEIMA